MPLPFREVPLSAYTEKGRPKHSCSYFLSHSRMTWFFSPLHNRPQGTPRHMELMQVSGAGRVCFLWIFQKEQAPQQGLSCSAALGHFTAMPPWKWHATAISIQRQADFQPSLGWSPPPAEDYCHNHSSSRLSTATMSNSKHFLTTVS